MGMKVNERERACEGGDEREKVAWWSGQYEMGMANELVKWVMGTGVKSNKNNGNV